MRSALLAAGILAGAGATLWLLLGGSRDAGIDAETAARGRGEAAPPAPASVEPPPVAPAPIETIDESPPPPGWEGMLLPIPEEGGVLTGEDLLAAVEKAGALRVRAEPADLRDLRAFRFENHPRHHLVHSMVEPLLQEAGFEVDRAGRTLVLRRRPPEPPPEGPRR